jgi:hypothetical protein
MQIGGGQQLHPRLKEDLNMGLNARSMIKYAIH